MALAPIVLFVYNRPWHTEQTLNALAANGLANQSALFIYADGPKHNAPEEVLQNIKKTREIIRKTKWCKEVVIIESQVNNGLANSIIRGVTEVINARGKIIVLEDDLVTHPFFLTYMNEYLNIYENTDSVISIHGFMYPVKKEIKSPFFLKGADCWGWATWKRGWDLFEPDSKQLLDKILERKLTREFNLNDAYNYTSLLEAQINGEVDSWAIRWHASAFLSNKLTLYPPVSLVINIGFDGSGTHKDNIPNKHSLGFDFEKFEIKAVKAEENKKNKRLLEDFFKGDGYLVKSIKNKLHPFYGGKIKNLLTDLRIIQGN